MNILEIRARQAEVESQITKLIQEFESEANIAMEEIDFELIGDSWLVNKVMLRFNIIKDEEK